MYTSSASVVFEGKDQAGVDESLPFPEHPFDDYNETKAIAEKAVLGANGQYGLSTVALRVVSLFGSVRSELRCRLANECLQAQGPSSYSFHHGPHRSEADGHADRRQQQSV